MAKYIDGFVLVVPKGKETEYEEMSESFKDQAIFEMPNNMTKMAYGGFEAVVEG